VDKFQKNECISFLNKKFNVATTVVVAHYAGLSVSDITELRNQMRYAGGMIKVVKNRLAKIACQGTAKECLINILTGPTIIAFSEDPVVAARVINDFTKKNKNLLIVGGAFNSQLLNVEDVKNLATMPSLDELRGKIVGLLSAPAIKLVRTIQAPARQIVGVLHAHANKVS
jgi:large subunit ribosomal protein L10